MVPVVIGADGVSAGERHVLGWHGQSLRVGGLPARVVAPFDVGPHVIVCAKGVIRKAEGVVCLWRFNHRTRPSGTGFTVLRRLPWGVIGTIMLGLVAAVRKGDSVRFTKIEEDNKALWIATESNRSKADERHEYLLSTVATKTDISGLREDIRSALHQGNGRGR